MIDNPLSNDSIMLFELVDDFDEVLVNLVELLDRGKVLRYFVFDGLPYFTELLINNLVHKESNILELLVATFEHLLWILGLVENPQLGQ